MSAPNAPSHGRTLQNHHHDRAQPYARPATSNSNPGPEDSNSIPRHRNGRPITGPLVLALGTATGSSSSIFANSTTPTTSSPLVRAGPIYKKRNAIVSFVARPPDAPPPLARLAPRLAPALPAWFAKQTGAMPVKYGKGYVTAEDGRVVPYTRPGPLSNWDGSKAKTPVVKKKEQTGQPNENAAGPDRSTTQPTASTSTSMNPHPNDDRYTATSGSNKMDESARPNRPPKRLKDLPRPSFLPAIPGPGLALPPSSEVEAVIERGDTRAASDLPEHLSTGKTRLSTDCGDEGKSKNKESPKTMSKVDSTIRSEIPTDPIFLPSRMSTLPANRRRKIQARELGSAGKHGRDVVRGLCRLRDGMRVLVDPIQEAVMVDVDPEEYSSADQDGDAPMHEEHLPTDHSPSVLPALATSASATPVDPCDMTQTNKAKKVEDPTVLARAHERLERSIKLEVGQSRVEQRAGEAMKVCKYWARGFCKDSVTCPFLHPIPERPFDRWLVPVPAYIIKSLMEQKRRRLAIARSMVDERDAAAQARETEHRGAYLLPGGLIRPAAAFPGDPIETAWMDELPCDLSDIETSTNNDEMEIDPDLPSSGGGESGDEDGELEPDTESESNGEQHGDYESEGSMSFSDSMKDAEFVALLMAVNAADHADKHEKATLRGVESFDDADNDDDHENDVEPEDGATIAITQPAPGSDDDNPTSITPEETVIYFSSGGPGGGPFATRLTNDYQRDPRFNQSLFNDTDPDLDVGNLFPKCVCCRDDAEDWFLSEQRGRKKPGQIVGRSQKTLQIYPSCGHPVCNQCTRQHRRAVKPSTTRKAQRPEKETKCTQCNAKSSYTFPANLGVRNFKIGSDRMTECLENYKEHMKSKLCRYLLQTTRPGRRPFCPFGDDCFYLHEVKGMPYKFNHGVERMMKLYKTKRNNRHERAARRAARLRRYGRNLSCKLNKLWKVINMEIFDKHRWKTYSMPGRTYAGKIAIDETVELPTGKVVLRRLESAGKHEFVGKLRKCLEKSDVKLDLEPDLNARRLILSTIVAIVYEKWPTTIPDAIDHPRRVPRPAVAHMAIGVVPAGAAPAGAEGATGEAVDIADLMNPT